MSAELAVPATRAIHELFVYLCVSDAAAAVDFYGRIFGAHETFRLEDAGGRVGHAELRFGPTTVMISDEHPEHGVFAPSAHGGSGVTLHLHVDDVDQLARCAVDAGAVNLAGPTDHAHGERQCRLRDPFGHTWLLGQQLEDLSIDEIARRYRAIEEPQIRETLRNDGNAT